MSTIREEDLLNCLHRRYPEPAWAFLPHVRDATGYAGRRTIDALALSLWPSRGIALLGFEIKTARGDWLRELKDPEKADFFAKQCHEFYVVAPNKTVIDPSEVPPAWGFLVLRGKRLFTLKKAEVKTKVKPPSWIFLASLLREVERFQKVRREELIHPSEIAAEVADAVQVQTMSIERQAKRTALRLKELEEAVSEFRKASGVSITRWDGGDIGAAVALVQQHGETHIQDRLKNSARLLRTEADRLDSLLEKLQDSASESATMAT